MLRLEERTGQRHVYKRGEGYLAGRGTVINFERNSARCKPKQAEEEGGGDPAAAASAAASSSSTSQRGVEGEEDEVGRLVGLPGLVIAPPAGGGTSPRASSSSIVTARRPSAGSDLRDYIGSGEGGVEEDDPTTGLAEASVAAEQHLGLAWAAAAAAGGDSDSHRRRRHRGGGGGMTSAMDSVRRLQQSAAEAPATCPGQERRWTRKVHFERLYEAGGGGCGGGGSGSQRRRRRRRRR